MRQRRAVSVFLVATLIAALAEVAIAAPTAAAEPATTEATSTAAPVESPALPAGAPGGYQPLTSTRVLDTRSNLGASGPVSGGHTIQLALSGVAGVPADGVAAVALHVTGLDATGAVPVTVFASDTPRPTAPTLHVSRNRPASHLVFVPLGADGTVSFFVKVGSVQLLADVQGWFPANGDYHPLPPTRVHKSHLTTATKNVAIAGVAGVPSSGVAAVVLDVAALKTKNNTGITVWPSDEPRPEIPSVRALKGHRTSDMVVVPLGADGGISIANEVGAVDVAVQVHGWIASDGAYNALTPARVLDTQHGQAASGALGSAQSIDVGVAGVGNVPESGVAAVLLDVSTASATKATSVTVWPTGASRPTVRSLNSPKGGHASNLVVLPLGADGKVSLFNEAGSAHLTLDVVGWFAAEPPNPAVAWRFVPRQMLLAPGETRQSTLTQTDVNGHETAADLPEGTTFATTGADGVVSVTPVGNGVVEITAGPTIDAVIVGAQIPGVSPAPTLAVTIATVKQGVVKIPDDAVLFPQTDLPVDGNALELQKGDVDAGGVGPFTWGDIQARVFLPDGAADVSGVTSPLPDQPRIPVVVKDPAPATGTIVVGDGGSALMGKVVEPPGLPTLSMGGYSLLSVALVGLQDVYQDLSYAIDADALSGIGALPTSSSSDEAPFAPAGHLSARRGAVHLADDDDLTFDGANGGGEPEKRSALQRLDDCTKQLKGQLGTQFGELQPAIDVAITPVANAFIIIQDGTLQKLRLELGGTVTVTVQLAVKFEATVFAELSCPMADLGEVEMMAPGPLAALLSFKAKAEQRLKLSIKIEAGPKLEAGVSCTMSATAIGGFDWFNSGGLGTMTNRSKGEVKPPECEPKFSPALNVSSAGVGASVEITGGLPVVMPSGIQLGGKVVGALLRVLRQVVTVPANTGFAPALRVEFGPQVKWVWETVTNTLTFEKAKSSFGLELAGKIGLETAPWIWILNKFGLVDPGFEVTLYQETVPLISAYQPLNVTDLTYSLNSEAPALVDQKTTPTVYVEEGDLLEVQSLMKPSDGGTATSLTEAQLDSGSAWKSNGATYDESHLFTITPETPSGPAGVLGKVQLHLETDITHDKCVELHDPQTFAIAGDAPSGGLPVPAWGGKIILQCVDGRMKFDPPTVTGQPAARASVKTTLITDGESADEFTLDESTLPDFATVAPTSGPLLDHAEQKEVVFDIKGRLKTCEVQEARSQTVTFTSKHRGVAKVEVVQPRVTPRSDCDKLTRTGGGSGDPHMTSMDGLRYDAQVLGEYVWLRPVAPNSGPVLHVRQELTAPGSTGVAQPTSATAVALELSGHKIEVYQRPTFLVLVDGAVTNLADGVTIEVSPDLSLVRNGTAISIQGDDFGLGINGLDVTVTVPTGSPLEGLLGTPDGNPANDLAVAGTSVTYTLDEIREHGTALYAVTDSWRVTDPAASLFTNGYAGFNDTNPPHNSADLDDERAQVMAALGDLNHICTGDVSSGAYIVDALAFELAIGRPLSDLSRFTCTYLVQGRATIMNTNGVGVSGLTVRVDGTGVLPCITTTGNDGVYSCRVVPDLGEIAAPIPLPLELQVTAAWPDAPFAIVATSTATFDVLAPVEGAPVVADAPLSLDASTLPSLQVTGTMTGPGGSALTGPILVSTTAYDANGVVVGGYLDSILPATVDGSYQLQHFLPRGAVRADVLVAVGTISDYVTQSFTGLSLGANERQLNVVHDPPVLHLTGTAVGEGGQPLAGTYHVQVRRILDTGQNRTNFFLVDVDPTTGSYGLTLALEKATVRAEITFITGSFTVDWPQAIIDPVVAGPNPVTLDVRYAPPKLQVSGTMTRDGTPITSGLTMRVTSYNASDAIVSDANLGLVLDGAGHYELPVTLPTTAVRATATANVSPFEAENPTISIPDLTEGVNARTFDVADVTRRLSLTGTALRDGAPVTQTMAISASYFDAAGTRVGTSGQPLTPGAGGAYAMNVRIPINATRASVVFAVPAGSASGSGDDIVTFETTGLVAGVNNRTFDINLVATKVSVTGLIKWLGVTQTGRHTFLVSSRDVNGFDLGTQFISVTLAGDGTYSFVAGIPTDSVEVSIAVSGLAHTDGRFNEIIGLTHPVVSGQTTDIVQNLDSLGLGMTGYVYQDGVPQAERDIDLVVTTYDTGVSQVSHSLTIHTNDDASYELNDTQVLFSGSIDRVTVDVADGPRLLEFAGIAPGVYDAQVDIDLSVERGLFVHGAITQDGAPYIGDGTVDIELRPYAFDPNEYAASPPYKLAFVEPFFLHDWPVDENGRYDVSIPDSMPSNVSAVEVRITVDADSDPVTYSQSVVLPPHSHDDIDIPFDVQHDTPRFMLSGHALTDPACGGAPFIFTVDIWTFDSTAPTEYDDTTGTWEGGVRQVTRVIVPDPDTGAFDLAMWMPDGTVRLGVRMQLSDAYEQLAGGTTVVYQADFDGVSSDTWDLTAGCLS